MTLTSPQAIYLIALSVVLVTFIGLGSWISGSSKYLGILIDSRNKMSLSRLQLVSWTIAIISGIFAFSFTQFSTDFVLPTEVWALLGISVGSTAGAVIVKGNKSAQTTTIQNASGGSVSLPLQHRNAGESEASLKDLFGGEENSDSEYVDIAKVQMFFFTLIAIVSYSFSLWEWLGDLPALANAADAAATELVDTSGKSAAELVVLKEQVASTQANASRFPEVSTQLATILGISHTGYLTVKAAPKS